MSNIKLFESKKIRSVYNETESKWYFSIVDVIGILTDSPKPGNYWKVLKHRLIKEGSQLVTKCNQLKMQSADGKSYLTDVGNTEILLRLIQSIPSPKAEPFKLWLAQVGYERLEEIENPEIATQRTRDLYKQKGYPDDWIEKRMRSIAIREELTDEWKKHEVREQKDYAILTAEIAKATFGFTPAQHKKFKNLKRENLRDHMTDLELIFSMLGEASTSVPIFIGIKTKHPKGLKENKIAAKQGGNIAGNARKALEIKTGEKVVTKKNYLPVSKQTKQLN